MRMRFFRIHQRDEYTMNMVRWVYAWWSNLVTTIPLCGLHLNPGSRSLFYLLFISLC
uniref:Uncharacterized protein n=1 Tax=Ascaris lumbricoides TaxID=6252 RepID=A0A0M3HHG6_ASCLU